MLYQLGTVQFDTAPTNLHRVERESGADFAAHEVVGAQRPREFMGEADEKITLNGKIFPHAWQRLMGDSGLSALAYLDMMRASGDPQILVRGDGAVLGWYFIEKVRQEDEKLDGQGVGKEITLTVSLVKSPQAASPISMFTTLIRLLGP